jgi:transmembrane protein TMEM174 (potassium channel)
MSDTGPAETRRRISLRTTRMEALSDGIFAIAATLLVLDLVIPAVTSKDVGHKLAEQRLHRHRLALCALAAAGHEGQLRRRRAGPHLEARPQPGVLRGGDRHRAVAPGGAVVLYFVIALFMIIPFRTVLREVRHRRRA